MTDLEKEIEEIAQKQVDRLFEDMWKLQQIVADSANVSPENEEWLKYSFKPLARAWFNLGRRSYETGAGIPIRCGTTRIPTATEIGRSFLNK